MPKLVRAWLLNATGEKKVQVHYFNQFLHELVVFLSRNADLSIMMTWSAHLQVEGPDLEACYKAISVHSLSNSYDILFQLMFPLCWFAFNHLNSFLWQVERRLWKKGLKFSVMTTLELHTFCTHCFSCLWV